MVTSLHFPELFHEKLDEVMHFKNHDGTIKYPIKNQMIAASFAIDEYHRMVNDIYKKSDSIIRNYNDELKRLYRDLVRKTVFEKNGRGIPEDWKLK